MDLDGNPDTQERHTKAETIFAKSEQLTATFYAQLPVEVRQALKAADFYRDAFSGDVDPLTGFAIVASVETCFALTGTPTCYIFLCPVSDINDPMATPFHALVPYGSSREPGLIVSSPTGEVRFWDGLGMGLAGGDNFLVMSLDLEREERVTTLTRADPQTYIVSTSMGRLFRLILTASGGSHHLTAHVFSHPRASMSISRLIPSFWSVPSIQPEPGNINAIALAEPGTDSQGRALWAIINRRIQKWNLSFEGWQELVVDTDIMDDTRQAIRNAFASASPDDIELDLEFVDLKVEGDGKLVLLVSYAGQDEEASMDFGPHPRRIYAIAHLLCTPDTFEVLNVRGVPYQSTSSSGAPLHPRLQLVMNGELIVIQFGDAVALCARDTVYMDRLELKSATDRTLGVGVVDGESELLVLTATTMVKAYFELDRVSQFNSESGRATLMVSIMTQAILYGSNPENPLQFSFPPEIDEEALMSGAQQLSQAILRSDSEVVRPSHDLQAQISGRKERLSFLIKFINDNAVLTKANVPKEPAVARYRRREAEDCVRSFLKSGVEAIGGLIPCVLDVVRRSLHAHSQNLSEDICESNRIVLTILQSAISYRIYNSGVYGIELPLLDPWSSQPNIIEVVFELVIATTKVVETPSPDAESTQTRVQLREQLPELASTLFTCIQERLRWLESPLSASDPRSERERYDLAQKFHQVRPEVLETLRRNGHANAAFRLAEEYRDFRSLASLCNKETVYPPEDNPNATRIQAYVEQFKEEFTTELYHWYIEHGELRAMFAAGHDEFLDAFLSDNSIPAVSWIHDVYKGRYELASEALLSEADHASELVSKHLMLSIGKLAHLAQLHEVQEVQNPISQKTLDSFHDGLDFVSVHETILDDLKSALVNVRGKQSLEAQVDVIARAKASQLSDRRILQQIFKQLVRQLLQGKALSPEDLADVLSLKDNADSPGDYATALQILSRARNIPSARRLSAFRTVWRRIYIHDDWNVLRQTANVPDAELNMRFRNTALYAALQATSRAHSTPKGYISTPVEALEVPDQSEIALRWPGISPDEVEGIEQDYLLESKYLADLEMDSTFESMVGLVKEDAT
ncbi:uncharacterized protein FIBRA_04513 [Fibroporia radiculosa]|uniref:Nucleoporin Nup133/Nup155-like C-terminal domain-containing protein n=1 Tax=Fibroporia radiculosa TaxID=599839 RepID=J4GPD5_9APHY|nr:uncharacterized protein FIBRA_04513 [Fibroporia radiculosa]CCM02415.1 predicted protein [Fibroporia radiculosa]